MEVPASGTNPLKVCTGCCVPKPPEAYAWVAGRIKRVPRCKECVRKGDKARNETLKGYLKVVHKNSKSSTEVRNARGRGHVSTLTLAELEAKWHAQRGLCAISRIPMVHKAHSDFRASLERLDNNVGYTDTNTVLVISEMNTVNQWTREKFQYLFSGVSHEAIPLSISDLQPPEPLYVPPRFKWVENGDGTMLCHTCGEVRDISMFHKTRNQGCNDCRRARDATRFVGQEMVVRTL